MQTEAEILGWLVATIAKETGHPPESIDVDESVHALGVDSALVISLTFDLEEQFGAELNPAALFEQPSLRAFAAWLADHLRERAKSG